MLCPSNTFMATPLAAIGAGAEVEFVDCNRDDLCMSFEDFERKAERHKPRAAILVHIGGHIAFDSERIAAYCRDNGIFLLEDCAHAHGADWNGRRPGGFGDAGVYSLYATKTVSTGEGGVLVSGNQELIDVRRQVPQLRQVRARGRRPQLPDERVHRRPGAGPGRADGGDRRLEERVRRRAPRPGPPGPPRAARGDDLGLSTSTSSSKSSRRPPASVYDQPCHRIMGRSDELPNTDWVAENHWCVPLYYRPESREAALSKEDRMRVLVTGGGGFIGSHVVDRLLDRGMTAADLRPQRLAVPLAARGRDLHRLDHRPGQPRPGDARLRRRHPPRRRRRRLPRPRRPGPGRGGQHPRHPQRARGRRPAPRSAASSTARPPGSTATASSRTSARRLRSRLRATSTPRPSSPARPTAPATPSSTTSRARCCASAFPTARAPAPPASSPSSPTSPSKARR